MRPRWYTVAVIWTGKNGIDSSAPTGQFASQSLFHLQKLVPTIVPSTNAGLIRYFHDRNTPAVCRGDQVGGARDERQVGYPREITWVLHDYAVSIQEKCRPHCHRRLRRDPDPNPKVFVKTAVCGRRLHGCHHCLRAPTGSARFGPASSLSIASQK